MEGHGKAPSAGSILGRRTESSRSDSVFATRSGAAPDKGSDAPSCAYRTSILLVLSIALLSLLVLPSLASAAKVHLFKESFGSIAKPAFATPEALTVDQSSGDLLVMEKGLNEKQSITVSATSGQFKLTFQGQTTEFWTGSGVVTCNGTSTSITSATTSAGTLSANSVGEVITSSPASCIEPGTTISAVSGTTITLSRATESNASSGVVSLAAERSTNPTTGWAGQGTLSPSSTAVTSLSSTSGAVSKGELIEGPGIKANTTVVACVPANCLGATSLTLSQTTEASASGVQSLTTELPYNVSATNLKEALEKLSGIGLGNVAVTGGPGNASGSSPYAVEYKGAIATRDVAQIGAQNGATPLAGGTGINVATTTPGVTSSIQRFKPNGEAAPFTALGGNSIDAIQGAGGKACGEEASSCDVTPQRNGFVFGTAKEVEIAIDNSGGIDSGNIYVTQSPKKLIDIFSSAGSYLGQLTAASATSFGEVCGVATDPAGSVYASEFTARRIYKFTPSGNPVTNINGSTLTTLASGTNPCATAAGAASTAGQLFVAKEGSSIFKVNGTSGAIENAGSPVVSGSTTTIAIDPASGHLMVASGSTVIEYDASGSAAASSESGLSAGSAVQGVAVSGSTGNVYITRSGSTNVEVFGPAVSTPTIKAFEPTEVAATSVTLNGSVAVEANPLETCVFEYDTTPYTKEQASHGNSIPCSGTVPTDGNPHPVSAHISGLQPEASYFFRIVAANAAGPSEATRAFSTAKTVVTEPASNISAGGVTLNGSVNPAGLSIVECKFEYGTTISYGQSVPCSPAAAAIPDDFDPHAVTGAVTGLAKNTTYHFRLSATNASGTALGGDRTFTTLGPPQIVEQLPLDVERTRATLRARLNPSGAATTYHFEWGPTAAYGNRIPADHDLFIGSGMETVTVTAELSDLQQASSYHFRVVATNANGATIGADRQLETLNEYGLPNHRGLEQVSMVDKRPIGNIEQLGVGQVVYQPALTGNQMTYLLNGGAGETPAGGEVIYSATRSAGGWNSTEISAPSLISAPEAPGDNFSGVSGQVPYVDPEDGKCAVVSTFNPLTADTPARSVEFGVTNLYRWNAADHSYTLITNRVPLNMTAVQASGGYVLTGASQDCSRIFFRSEYSFISGASGLYEWDEESGLHDATRRPDGSVAPLSLDQAVIAAKRKNAVSSNGRFFFSVPSSEGADIGKRAVFVRRSPTETVDASQPTNGPTLGASYEGASPDGSRVFFLANYGIAATSSAGPTENCSKSSSAVEEREMKITSLACDLYSYTVDTGQLTDVSADATPANTKGAVVQGVLAMSKDGSVVYFAARGQLVPGKGRTHAENLQGSGFANIYRYDSRVSPGEALAYVGSITARDIEQQALIRRGSGWTSQTNDAGTYLLYASRDNMTGTNAQEVESAYIYSSATGANECISCPRNGTPPGSRYPVSATGAPTVLGGLTTVEAQTTSLIRSLSEDGRAIFNSEDVLAPGAIKGEGITVGTAVVKFPVQTNIYEWHDGQVSLLATGKVSADGMAGPEGRDVFIKTYDQLTGSDFDFAADIYDLRSGGGFPSPPPPPPPCDPSADQCQGSPASQPGAVGGATQSFAGPGNPPVAKAAKPRHCRKGSVRRGGKCASKKKSRGKRKGHSRNAKRAAKANRGGVK
jgi:hypothetical protein